MNKDITIQRFMQQVCDDELIAGRLAGVAQAILKARSIRLTEIAAPDVGQERCRLQAHSAPPPSL